MRANADAGTALAYARVMGFIKGLAAIVFLAIVVLVIVGVASVDKKKITHDAYRSVIDDSIDQYNIAKRSGSKMDACVQAGFVSAAYLQAKDEDGYKHWKDVEKADCKRAGL